MCGFFTASEEASELLLGQREPGLRFWEVTWDLTFGEIHGRQEEGRPVSLGAEMWS